MKKNVEACFEAKESCPNFRGKNRVHISEGGEVCIDSIRAFKFYDHMRMKHKIKQLTPLINPILNYEHRKKVFIDRGYDKIELNSLSEVV